MQSVQIPVEVREGDGMTIPHKAFVWSSDGKASVVYQQAYSLPKLKKVVRMAISDTLDWAQRMRDNRERLAIGCGDGTVLLVEFFGDSWGYSVLAKGSRTGMMGVPTFQEAVTDAREHAQQSYGGIAWEMVR